MADTQTKYGAPRLKVLGSARDVYFSDEAPGIKQAVRELNDGPEITRAG